MRLPWRSLWAPTRGFPFGNPFGVVEWEWAKAPGESPRTLSERPPEKVLEGHVALKE